MRLKCSFTSFILSRCAFKAERPTVESTFRPPTSIACCRLFDQRVYKILFTSCFLYCIRPLIPAHPTNFLIIFHSRVKMPDGLSLLLILTILFNRPNLKKVWDPKWLNWRRKSSKASHRPSSLRRL